MGLLLLVVVTYFGMVIIIGVDIVQLLSTLISQLNERQLHTMQDVTQMFTKLRSYFIFDASNCKLVSYDATFIELSHMNMWMSAIGCQLHSCAVAC